MVEPVAEALGNTPAMSRKAYVHPALIEAVKARPRDPLDGLRTPARAQMAVIVRGRADPVPQQGLQKGQESGRLIAVARAAKRSAMGVGPLHELAGGQSRGASARPRRRRWPSLHSCSVPDFGQRAVARDPKEFGWRSVIGRILREDQPGVHGHRRCRRRRDLRRACPASRRISSTSPSPSLSHCRARSGAAS